MASSYLFLPYVHSIPRAAQCAERGTVDDAAAMPTIAASCGMGRYGTIQAMKEKMSAEQFQEFVVEQLGKIAGQVSTVQDDVGELRTDQQSLRKSVVTLADGQRELRGEISKLRGEIADVKEELQPIANAVDKDALKIVQHDRRIKVLERHGGGAAR